MSNREALLTQRWSLNSQVCFLLWRKLREDTDPATVTSVDLGDIKTVKLCGTADDYELVEGLVLTQKVANSDITWVKKTKVGLFQYCLPAPITDMDK